jgi:hypothetical protein
MDNQTCFFGMFISFTCDMHIKLDILNPLNIILLSNGLKNESFALQPFPSKFQDFEIFERFGFSSSSCNEHVEWDMFFVVQIV